MLLLTLISLTAAEPPTRAAEAADTTVPVPPGTRLRLETTQGEIVVRAWDRNQVRVQTAGGRRGDVRVRLSGRVLTVDASNFQHPPTGDYDITVPVWMGLSLENMNGSITVEGVRAPLEISTLNGDIRVHGGSESIQLEALSGQVVLTGARGRIDLSTASNHIIATDIQGDLNIEAISGDIVLRNVDSKSVNLETVSGSMYFGGPIHSEGRYVFSAHSGNTFLGVAEGTNATISIDLVDGVVQAGFALPLIERGRARKQTYRVGNGSAAVQIESFSGRVHLLRPDEFSTWVTRWEQAHKAKEQKPKEHQH